MLRRLNKLRKFLNLPDGIDVAQIRTAGTSSRSRRVVDRERWLAAVVAIDRCRWLGPAGAVEMARALVASVASAAAERRWSIELGTLRLLAESQLLAVD